MAHGPNGYGPINSRRPGARRGSRRLWRWLAGLALAGLIGLGVLAVMVIVTAAALPDHDQLVTRPKGQSIVVRAVDGSVLATTGPSYGEWLSYDQLPKTIVQAMVAVEDRRFWWHPGIDPRGFGRAMWTNLKCGCWRQGGSTLTQQVAKNVFLTSERTFARKGREMILALALETRLSKEQILELYLNRVYFGGGAYGVDAASRRFFGHPATVLSQGEAAILAGLVKAPTRYAPSSDQARSRARARTVLETMVDAGALTRKQASAVDLSAVRFTPAPRQASVRYFTDWVMDQAVDLTQNDGEPLDVRTTLDPRVQAAAERALRENLPRQDGEPIQGAVVALGMDGSVKAMVGGRDYPTSSYNRAVLAQRQPGSAFKLFVYVAALEAGYRPEDIVVDEPITLGRWSPKNSNRQFRGEVTLEEAFARSINTVAVRLADDVGFGEVARVARRLGIATRVSTEPAMALGASEVTLLDLTSAYRTVGAGGIAVTPHAISEIRTTGGRVLYQRPTEAGVPVISPRTASDMVRMLTMTVQYGTGTRAATGRPVAGKTGTTSDNRDGWFLGFSGDMAVGVWMGRDDAKPVRGLSGGRAPARAWSQTITLAQQGQAQTPLFQTEDPALVEGNEPDSEAWGYAQSDPVAPAEEPATLPADPGGRLDEQWLDQALGPDEAPAPSPPMPEPQ